MCTNVCTHARTHTLSHAPISGMHWVPALFALFRSGVAEVHGTHSTLTILGKTGQFGEILIILGNTSQLSEIFFMMIVIMIVMMTTTMTTTCLSDQVTGWILTDWR